MTNRSDKELTDASKGAAPELTRQQRMIAVLTERFSPTVLVVDDDSARHHGHAGASPHGQTHFNVVIVSTHFEGQSRLARQRAVNDALAGEFATGLHALSIKARAPQDAD